LVTGNARPLDAATLMLEVGLSALVRQAGDKLRRRRIWWRRRAVRSAPQRGSTRALTADE
jgi:hypothetical protein